MSNRSSAVEGKRAAGTAPGLRADARRNRERILAAARDVFVEQGADAPLDEIAARAGVGIATLYRRFPDRGALTCAVVLDVLGRVAEEARLALAEEPDAFRALARYMHRALDLRVSAVVPALLGQVSLEDEEISPVRERSARLIEEMIDRAQADGTLRSDAAFADVALLLVRLARPLPGPVPRALDEALAHRHLDLLLDGLRVGRDRPVDPLPAPAMTRGDLRALPPAGERSAASHEPADRTPAD
jgi:AcrR family transcriptional regulator